MIQYESGGFNYILKICQTKGSVFPKALKVAVPCGMVAAVLRMLIDHVESFKQSLDGKDSIMEDSAAWSGFSFFVGFLIVFRTSEAYNRFWEGCTSTHQMRAEWFDGCSSLISFCKHSQAGPEAIKTFQGTLIRLFSMLHASALAEIEDSSSGGEPAAFNYALIDPYGLDHTSLRTVRESGAKVELIFQWIQQLVVENISSGVLSIPPPILSRSFQEIANGMVAFHEAMKISYIPFPFPYAQTCDLLLMMHWVAVPLVVSTWCTTPYYAAVFAFIQVFTLWALNFIAVEIENPFGLDDNDIDGRHMQHEMNEHLLLLLASSTLRTPLLNTHATNIKHERKWQSFRSVWADLDPSSERPGSGIGAAPSGRRKSMDLRMMKDGESVLGANDMDMEITLAALKPGRNSRFSFTDAGGTAPTAPVHIPGSKEVVRSPEALSPIGSGSEGSGPSDNDAEGGLTQEPSEETRRIQARANMRGAAHALLRSGSMPRMDCIIGSEGSRRSPPSQAPSERPPDSAREEPGFEHVTVSERARAPHQMHVTPGSPSDLHPRGGQSRPIDLDNTDDVGRLPTPPMAIAAQGEPSASQRPPDGPAAGDTEVLDAI